MDVLSTLGTIALALASGAGGAALLELFWKPRRDRKKAATLLLAEILLNTELLLLQAHARAKTPKRIPGDFRMSTLAWETAAQALVELPPETLKSVLLLYNRYGHLNESVTFFDAALRDIAQHSPASAEQKRAERQADVIIDVFNTGIDAAIDQAKQLTPDLFSLAKITPAGDLDTSEFGAKLEQLRKEREERIRRLSRGS